LKEQNKYDQKPLDLFDRLQRILPLADKVAEDIVCEKTEILDKTVPQLLEVMQTAVNISCDYIKRGRFGGQSFLLDSPNADDRRENERRIH
jgi:hypothetical protein